MVGCQRRRGLGEWGITIPKERGDKIGEVVGIDSAITGIVEVVLMLLWVGPEVPADEVGQVVGVDHAVVVDVER